MSFLQNSELGRDVFSLMQISNKVTSTRENKKGLNGIQALFVFPPLIKSLQSLKFCSLWYLNNGTSLLYCSLCIKYNLWDPLLAYIAISRSVNFNLLAYCLVTNYSQTQGCTQPGSQKGVLNSADPCSVQTQIHYLAKYLTTKNNVHHPDMIIHILL